MTRAADPLNRWVMRFFSLRPWERVDDRIFGLSFEQDRGPYFASVMGGAGEQFGLLIARGWKSYGTLQGMLREDLDRDSAMLAFDAISVTAEEDDEAPRQFRTYAKKHDFRLLPRLGRPMVMVKEPNRMFRLPTAAEEQTLLRCLEAVVFLAEQNRLGAIGLSDHRKALVYEIRQEAGRLIAEPRWRTAEVPAAAPSSKTRLTGELRTRLAALPRLTKPYLVSARTGGIAVKGEVVRLLLIYDEALGMILRGDVVMPSRQDGPDKVWEALLNTFEGENLAGQRGLPDAVVTDSKPLLEPLKSDLAELNIRLLCFPEVPELAAVREDLSNFLRSRPVR